MQGNRKDDERLFVRKQHKQKEDPYEEVESSLQL